MCFKSKTPWLILATLLTLVATLVTSAQQYDPRALQQPQAGQQLPVEDVDPFAAQWPIEVPSAQGKITLYQPQMEDLAGDMLSARAAVSIAEGNREPIFGVVWFKSRIATDRISRVVQVLNVTITQTRIPDADPRTEQALNESITQAMTQQPMELSLDQLLTMLESATPQDREAADLAGDAPRILFVGHPAIKVQYDGEPKLIPIEKSSLQRVANTPFFVVLDPASRTYFLKGGGVWYEAPDPMGPFKRATRVSQEAVAAADEFGYQDPQEPLPVAQLDRLEIITATEPTELVWTDGPAQMGTLPGTGLLYVTNTDSDVFMTVDSQRNYLLLSGRWYEAPSRSGPWTFVPPDRLPEDFSRIPPGSPSGDVLAHVAGTAQAQEAVADTYVPQTAAVNRLQFEQPAIEYDGDPRFEPVNGAASISYAVNSPQSVVVVDRRYYACHNAVWYVSSSPRGRWDLCTDVPDVIYTIPPSCPIYPVRYVYVYDSTPEFVYCGYTPGYVGCYVYDGVVVYGTGRRYQPWWGRTYYPRPSTFGFAARYNSYVNNWGFSFGLRTGGGSLWIGYSEQSWGRRDPWFGNGGYRPVLVRNDVRRDLFRYNYRDRVGNRGRGDRTNITIINEQNTYIRNVNVYERRNDVRRVDPPRTRGTDSARGGTPPRRMEERNNVLADREGRVYRRTNDGDLEVRDRGQWRSEGKAPAPVVTDRRGPARQGAQPQVTAAARPVEPEAARVQRRPVTPVRGADRPEARGDTAREGRGGDQSDARGAAARRGPAADPPPTARQTPPTARDNQADRGQAADRGNTPARGSTPAARDSRGDRGVTADRGNAGGQGNRGDRATPPAPSQRELQQVERDFRARQSAENRLPNYQRRDQASDTPRRGDSPTRGADAPARGRGNDSDRGRGNDSEGGRGRGGGNPDSRGRS